jgi:tetratricopeptide (TPR) repeat protein
MTTLQSALDRLETAGLLRPVLTDPDLEYLFRHALVQEAAYNSLLRADQRRLHAAAGEALEALFPDQRTGLAPILAVHYLEAGNPLRALAYFSLAGKAALAGYANVEAERHYRAALTLTTDDRERADLLAALAEALERQGRFAASAAAWAAAGDLYGATGDPDGVARMYAGAARTAWEAGDTPGALDLARTGLARTVGAAPSVGRAELLHEAARVAHFNGEPAQAEPLCRQALAMAQQFGATATEAQAWATLSLLPHLLRAERQMALERGVALAEAAGLLDAASRAHNNLGVFTDSVLGDPAGALVHYARAAALAGQRGAVSQQLFYLTNVIYLFLWTGDFPAAATTLAQATALHAQIGPGSHSGRALAITRAALARYQGDLATAWTALQEVLAACRAAGDLTHLSGAATFAGEVALAMGDPAAAETVLIAAIAAGDRGVGWGPVLPRCLLVAALASQGRTGEATAVYAAALACTTGRADDYYAREALALAAARLAAAEGRWAAAAAAYETTAAIERQLGLRWYLDRTLREAATLPAGVGVYG